MERPLNNGYECGKIQRAKVKLKRQIAKCAIITAIAEKASVP